MQIYTYFIQKYEHRLLNEGGIYGNQDSKVALFFLYFFVKVSYSVIKTNKRQNKPKSLTLALLKKRS